MRILPWILGLLSLVCWSSLEGAAAAVEPREPAKLSHVAPEDPTRHPSATRALRSLFTTDQDRIYAARQRVARASYAASKIQAGEVRPVDYSVLQASDEPELLEGEVLMEGPMPSGMHSSTTMHGGVVHGGSVHGGHVHGGHIHEGPGCDSCHGGAACGTCEPCDTVCFPLRFRLPLENLSVRAGVQGFKGPVNAGMDGSFGFLYGINWGAPLFSRNTGIGIQAGVNGSQANLYDASFNDHSRDQLFFTAGLFRRVDWGWQGGLVIDYMHDQWYHDFNATQLRGELSWMFQCEGEFGFWFTASDQSSSMETSVTLPGSSVPEPVSETFQPENMYAFFYRTPLEVCGGDMRLSGGWTGSGKGLVGADFSVPLARSLALETGFLFLLPKGDSDADQFQHETWNVGLNLVWYPRAKAGDAGKSYYRPLFNVAHNGTFTLRPE